MRAETGRAVAAKRGTMILVAALALTIGFAGFAWRSDRATDRLRREATAATEKRGRLAVELRQLEARTADETRKQGEIQAALDRRTRGPIAAATAATSPRMVLQVPPDNPEMQARALRTFQAGLALKYSAFYRLLGFDPERAAKFETLLTEHEGRKRDIRTAERGIRVDRATAVPRDAITVDGKRVQVLEDPSIATLRREEDDRFKAAQIALLGESGYAQLGDFERSTESRSLVSDLAGNLAISASPLTATQARGLVQALQSGNYSVKVEPEKTDWGTILAQVRPLLAPAQFEELQVLAARHKLQVDRNELSRLVQASRKKPGGD